MEITGNALKRYKKANKIPWWKSIRVRIPTREEQLKLIEEWKNEDYKCNRND